MNRNFSIDNEFDERQLQLRNKFGFQSFFIMTFLLVIFGLVLDFGVVFESPLMTVVMIILIPFCYFNVRCILAGAMNERQFSANSIFFPFLTVVWFILMLLHIINRDTLSETLYSLFMLLCFGISSAAILRVRHKEKHSKPEKSEHAE